MLIPSSALLNAHHPVIPSPHLPPLPQPSVCFLYLRVSSGLSPSLYSSYFSFLSPVFFPSVLFLKFHIRVKSYDICLSLTGLFHWALHSKGPSMLLPTARFHSFLWPNNIPLCICKFQYVYLPHFFIIHQSLDTWAISII